MLTEMLGKGGTLCSHARAGAIRCPLIVRPTSEDVITSHLFQSLGYLNPCRWLPDLLNEALGTTRFRRQVFRRLKISLWQNQPCYPRELLPYDEGSTQVDVVIEWENPPTTVFIEMKYLSGLSANVSGDDGTSGFPSDQLIRNIRVGLHRCGYFREEDELFPQPPRDLVVVLVSLMKVCNTVNRYRDSVEVKKAIPYNERLIRLPRLPFVGDASYLDIVRLLQRQAHWFRKAERRIAEDLAAYLNYKVTTAGVRLMPRHDDLPI